MHHDARQFLDTQTYVCPCCNEALHAEDFPDDDDFTHQKKVNARYGGHVCTACTEDHDICPVSGEAFNMLTAQAEGHPGFCSQECKLEQEEADRSEAEHYRLERMGL